MARGIDQTNDLSGPAPVGFFEMRDSIARAFAPRDRWVRIAQVAAVVLIGLVIRLALIQSAGYRDDIVIFYDWFKSVSALPPGQVYANTPGLNYPPMCVVLYELEAIVFRWFVHGPPSEFALNIAIKLPPILMDAVGTVLVYRIVRRFASHAPALLGAAFIAFNPAIIYDSAHWGQNDAIPTVLALFAMTELLWGKTILAWLSITAALFFKPPVLVLVPLMLLYPFRAVGTERRKRLIGTGAGLAVAGAFAEILAVTFFDHPNLVVATRHLIGQYVAFSNVFNYTSLNAFNLWALFHPFFTTDKTTFLVLSLHAWSDVIFIAAAGGIYWRYLRSRSATALLEASALVLLALFVLLTEMHERYLYYAVFFCAALVFKQPYRRAAIVLSSTLLLNLEYALTFMYLDDANATMIDRYQFAPWLARLCSAANIGVFVYLFASFLRPPRPAAPLEAHQWEPAHAS